METVPAVFEAWNLNDFDAWMYQYFDPEVGVVRAPGGVSRARRNTGRPGRASQVDLQLKARYEAVRDLGDSVLALGELTGTGRITGLNLNDEIAQLATFRNGQDS